MSCLRFSAFLKFCEEYLGLPWPARACVNLLGKQINSLEELQDSDRVLILKYKPIAEDGKQSKAAPKVLVPPKIEQPFGDTKPVAPLKESPFHFYEPDEIVEEEGMEQYYVSFENDPHNQGPNIHILSDYQFIGPTFEKEEKVESNPVSEIIKDYTPFPGAPKEANKEQESEKLDVNEVFRAPIFCVLGHVDAGFLKKKKQMNNSLCF